jgi:hypothetical protein
MNFLLPAHIAFMALALVLVVSAAVIAKRRKKNWLVMHKRCAISGTFSSLIAAICIVALKIAHGYSHFQSPHALAGLVTLCLLVIAPALGAAIPKGPKPLRAIHRFFGRLTAAAIVLTSVMGVFRFLQISKK